MPNKFIRSLSIEYRVRQVGELVTDVDYLQLGEAYYPLHDTCWIGEIIQHGGKFETIWTRRINA